MRNRLIQSCITVCLLSVFALTEAVGWPTPDCRLTHVARLACPFIHNNIFHLAANLCALWTFKRRISLAIFPIAILTAFLPGCENTVGFSSAICAHLGITWGRAGQFSGMCRSLAVPLVIVGLLPGINMLIHFYALFIGYFFAEATWKTRLRKI